MARKSTGRTGTHRKVRSSASSARSRDKEKGRSKRGSSSRGSSSRSASEREKVVSIAHGRKQTSARGRSSAATRVLTDHAEIRRWTEERHAHPARVRETGSREDVGIIRLDFPGYSGEQTLEEIEWDEWFQKFDENGLALVVQERTARGQKSNFNKLVKRETVKAMEESAGGRSRRKSAA